MLTASGLSTFELCAAWGVTAMRKWREVAMKYCRETTGKDVGYAEGLSHRFSRRAIKKRATKKDRSPVKTNEPLRSLPCDTKSHISLFGNMTKSFFSQKVAYHHLQGWQRPCKKLMGQCTPSQKRKVQSVSQEQILWAGHGKEAKLIQQGEIKWIANKRHDSKKAKSADKP